MLSTYLESLSMHELVNLLEALRTAIHDATGIAQEWAVSAFLRVQAQLSGTQRLRLIVAQYLKAPDRTYLVVPQEKLAATQVWIESNRWGATVFNGSNEWVTVELEVSPRYQYMLIELMCMKEYPVTMLTNFDRNYSYRPFKV